MKPLRKTKCLHFYFFFLSNACLIKKILKYTLIKLFFNILCEFFKAEEAIPPLETSLKRQPLLTLLLNVKARGSIH